MAKHAPRPTEPKPSPAPATAHPAVTPMMAQYLGIKAQHPDHLLFYRMGDFYELFLADAEVAAKALNIVLTKRGKHQGDDIPMCGVPVERSDDYLHRLISQGHRVAVCEQIEDPAEAKKRGGKSVVARAVVRLVTPGTITEDGLLDPARANNLVAVTRLASGAEAAFGVAAVDISTGAFFVAETTQAGLPGLLARLDPREIVFPDSLQADDAVGAIVADTGLPLTPVAREYAETGLAERRLREWYGVETLDGFGRFTPAETAAAAMAVAYVTRTQIGARPQLQAPARIERGGAMEIDPATRANLEITRTLGGEQQGSLLATVDLTVTAGGGRLLAGRIAAPLVDPAAIAARLDDVAWATETGDARARIRATLKRMPDLARALSRLALDRGGPRDLAALRDGLSAACDVALLLEADGALPAGLQADASAATRMPGDFIERLAAALGENLPLNKRDGGFVRPGFSPELDETRALRDHTREVIAALQGRYADETGVKLLRIKHNSFLGFYLEVPQAVGETWLRPPHNARFIHRQSMAGAMRFSTSELAELDARIASAAERTLAIELGIFADLAAAVLAEAPNLRAVADALSAIDVSCALGELAAARGWTRPTVDASTAFAIQGGRHPVVEAALKARGKSFVVNDCDLGGTADRGAAKGGGRIAVVTGPNMAGKSTFLRQNALIAILAQMGSFVPATAAHLGIVDRLFSRVGAADDLARGRSTFMVEMVETAAILNQAGPRSLVILDEIGRGTATFDGLSIAWAAVEHLHEANRSRALFATHYHELTQLTKRLKRVHNLTMRVTEWRGDVVFLHEVLPGSADRSYGIQVAKLAGLPPAVVDRARAILAQLERNSRIAPVERLVEDLPLFALHNPAPVEPADTLRAALDGIEPDGLTPKAALDALYALKILRGGEG